MAELEILTVVETKIVVLWHVKTYCLIQRYFSTKRIVAKFTVPITAFYGCQR